MRRTEAFRQAAGYDAEECSPKAEAEIMDWLAAAAKANCNERAAKVANGRQKTQRIKRESGWA